MVNFIKEGASVMKKMERKFDLHETYFKLDTSTVLHLVYLQKTIIEYFETEQEIRKQTLFTETEKLNLSELPQLEQMCLSEGDIKNNYELSHKQADYVSSAAQQDLSKLLEFPRIIREED